MLTVAIQVAPSLDSIVAAAGEPKTTGVVETLVVPRLRRSAQREFYWNLRDLYIVRRRRSFAPEVHHVPDWRPRDPDAVGRMIAALTAVDPEAFADPAPAQEALVGIPKATRIWREIATMLRNQSPCLVNTDNAPIYRLPDAAWPHALRFCVSAGGNDETQSLAVALIVTIDATDVGSMSIEAARAASFRKTQNATTSGGAQLMDLELDGELSSTNPEQWSTVIGALLTQAASRLELLGMILGQQLASMAAPPRIAASDALRMVDVTGDLRRSRAYRLACDTVEASANLSWRQDSHDELAALHYARALADGALGQHFASLAMYEEAQLTGTLDHARFESLQHLAQRGLLGRIVRHPDGRVPALEALERYVALLESSGLGDPLGRELGADDLGPSTVEALGDLIDRSPASGARLQLLVECVLPHAGRRLHTATLNRIQRKYVLAIPRLGADTMLLAAFRSILMRQGMAEAADELGAVLEAHDPEFLTDPRLSVMEDSP